MLNVSTIATCHKLTTTNVNAKLHLQGKKVKGCEDPKEQVRLNSLCDDSDVNAKKHKRERDIKAKT